MNYKGFIRFIRKFVYSLTKELHCIHDLRSIQVKSVCWKIIISNNFENYSLLFFFIDKVDYIPQAIKHISVYFSNS